VDARLPILELQYIDATGSKGTVTLNAQAGSTYDQMDADATALASIIAPVSSCSLIRQRIIYKFVATPRPAADDSSSVKRSGSFFFETLDGTRQTLVSVPGILDSVLTTEGDGAGILIDLENEDIQSLIALILDLPATSPFGHVMQQLVTAYRQSRA